MIAHPIEGIDYSSDASLLFDCYRGYEYLCNELNIKAIDDEDPKFRFQPDGRMVLGYGTEDPNENVRFDKIDEE